MEKVTFNSIVGFVLAVAFDRLRADQDLEE